MKDSGFPIEPPVEPMLASEVTPPAELGLVFRST